MAISYPIPKGGFNGLRYAATFHEISTLHHTPAAPAANLQQITVSVWIRNTLRNLSGKDIIAAGSNVSNVTALAMSASNYPQFYITIGGSVVMNVGTVGSINIQDSVWHHLCAVLDLSNATRSLRGRLWVDNVESNAGGDAQRPNNTTTEGHLCSAVRHDVGSSFGTRFWNGIVGAVHIVQGQVLDPTYFGQTLDGAWVWRDYRGSHGTNGANLRFDDPSDVGRNSV